MFSYLQSRIRGTAGTGPGAPPPGLIAFYWHFVRQTKGWYALMFVTSLAVALIDTVIPVFIGKLVSLMEAVDRQAALAREWPLLAGMVVLVLIVRPLVMLVDVAIRHNALIPGATSLIRWQSHWHVVRQSWPFFQNDFAGRIANRVMQTANALRESVMASIRAVWYIAVYGVSALVLMAIADWRLGVPTLAVVRRLSRIPALLRAAHARSRARELRGALARHGARGGQLHQHPHRQALRAAGRRGRLRARGDRRAPGCDRRAHAADLEVHVRAVGDERRAPHRHGGDRHLALGTGRGERGRRRDRACRWPGRSPTSPAG